MTATTRTLAGGARRRVVALGPRRGGRRQDGEGEQHGTAGEAGLHDTVPPGHGNFGGIRGVTSGGSSGPLTSSGGPLARRELHDRQLAVPVARRLPRGLLRHADELAAGAALGGDDRGAGCGSRRSPSTPPSADEHDGDPDAEVERVDRRLLLRAVRPASAVAGSSPGGRSTANGRSSQPRRPRPRTAGLVGGRAERVLEPRAVLARPPARRSPRSRSGPATRAIALLTAEAIPALCSSASESTVAVSGATTIDEPEREDEQRRQQVGPVVDVGVEAQHQHQPDRARRAGRRP